MQNPNVDVKNIIDKFEKSQWIYSPNLDSIKHLPIITREELRNMPMEKGMFECSTSGSTGESLKVQKSYADYVWYMATNVREMIWRKWDFTKNIAVIRPDSKLRDLSGWGIPQNIAPIQGNTYQINFAPISQIQSWLEEKNPHYIHSRPSILAELDLTKIPNLIDVKSTGELGGTMFSSEECGTISIQCPDNPSVHHVMENQIVEVDQSGNMIITTMTNKYVKRYKNGDCIELGECSCGRKLQTIKKINGRVRNMFVLPNGDKKWPLIGSKVYYEQFGIKKYKVIQKSIEELELHIIAENLGEREKELQAVVKKWLEAEVNVTIKYVESFPNYKHEEFISLVNYL